MGISLKDIFKRNTELAEVAYSYTPAHETAVRAYMKNMALDICANFIARAVSQSEFKTDDKRWYYRFNVRPNTDMSATQFWERLVYDLIVKNRVLVIMSDSDDLLIADSFSRNEYAVYEDTFEGVTVKDYTFKRLFRMNEVLYLEYDTEKLDRSIDGLFEDYSELFGKLLETIGRNGQIRGTVEVDASKSMSENDGAKLKKFMDNLFNSFGNKAVAVVPTTKGFEYKEHSNTTGTSNINVDELTKLKADLIDAVADVLGEPFPVR